MIVYMATNTVNRRRYIGATKSGLVNRRRKHHWDAWNRPYCRIFHAAIRKYGPGAFEWRVLATCSSPQELEAQEIRLIGEMKPEYNITSGGGRGLASVKRTPEWLARMSASAKRVAAERSPEERAARLRDLEKGRAVRWRRRRRIRCVEDGAVYSSAVDAADHYGISYTGVCSVLRGVQARAGGLTFVIEATMV